MRSSLAENATPCFSLEQLGREASETLPWLGAIFAGSYAALYARFSAQWQYLANLYNTIMATHVSLSPSKRKVNQETLASWKAAFIEDAQDLHLATKSMFAPVIGEMLEDEKIRAAYVHSVGKSRVNRLESQITEVLRGRQ